MSNGIDLKSAGERGLIGFYLKCIKSPDNPSIVREEVVYMQVLPKSGEFLQTEDGNNWKVFATVYKIKDVEGKSVGIPVVSAFWSPLPSLPKSI